MSNNKAKCAIVTGASSGIGKAAAISLLQNGWNTVFVGRRQDALEAAIEDAGPVNSEALAISCDVTQADAVEAMFATTIAKFSSVDLLFNNAGISGKTGTIDELSMGDWEEVLAVNLTGAFCCARAAFAKMRKQGGGRIINNGSIAAHTPRPQTVSYTITKHAITGLTKSLALDGRAYNIACGQIDIGNVLTDMTVPMTKGMLQANGEHKVEAVFNLPHVADAILYMANLPLEANVPFMTVMATKMPYIGRG